jgi:hypothetical protein
MSGVSSSYDSLRTRPSPLVVGTYVHSRHNSLAEGLVVSIGPRDHEFRTLRVYVPVTNQVLNCKNLCTAYASPGGIGTQYGFYAGDRVLVCFINGENNTPVVVASIPHTKLANLSEQPTEDFLSPLSNVPTAAEWGLVAEYVEVRGMLL